MQSRLVPVDLLCTTIDRVDNRSSDSPLLPVVSHRPMMALLRFLLHRKGSPDLYWQWYATNYPGSELDQEAHLAEWRRRIRRFRWLPLAPQPAVSQLTRDRLILESGVDVACLASTLGRRWIRVQMPDGLCALWDSRSISSLQDVVKETGRKAFYNPVLHEHYRRARISRPDSDRLDRMRRLLGAHGEGWRGLDIGCNMGYMCHMLQRQGFRMTGLDFSEGHLKVARALNETYRLDVDFVNCRFEEHQAVDGFDIVLLLTVLYHALNRSVSEAVSMISKVDCLGAAALFWESGAQPQREIDLICAHSGLTEYLSLGPTRTPGKRRELGVFLRPATTIAKCLRESYKAELADDFASHPHSVPVSFGG